MIFGGGFSNMIFFIIKCNCISIFQFLNIMQKKLIIPYHGVLQ
jgi:hypothetical protein